MPKTIKEQTREIVYQWIEHDLDEEIHSEYVATLKPELLQERIADALLEVARDQRHACAEALMSIEGDDVLSKFKSPAHSAVMNAVLPTIPGKGDR